MSPRARSSHRRSPAAVVYSCSGGTGVATLAAETAARLEELGLAASAASLESGADRAERHEQARIVAIDGCASACCTRALEAKGLHPTRIGLEELGVEKGTELRAEEREVVFARALSLLGPLLASRAERTGAETGGLRPPRRARRRPPSPGAGSPPIKRAHSIDDYLRAIHGLASPVAECGAMVQDAPTLAAHVSRVLGVSRAASGEMLQRLESEGLVARGARREVMLTQDGRVAAERAVHRHRVLERFLTDFLGCAPADSHAEAQLLRDAMSEEVIDRIAQRLGSPERCPHGWPLDPALERAESPELAALSSLAPHRPATIVRLAEQDSDVLAWLYDHGLTPGVDVEVLGRPLGEDQLSVRVGRREHVLGLGVAGAVFVRRRERGATSAGADASRARRRGGARGTRADPSG